MRRRAFHEAGHAIAAIALGFDVRTVTIKPDGQGCDGLTDVDGGSEELRAQIQARAETGDMTERDQELWRRDIVFTLAGGSAEALCAATLPESLPRSVAKDEEDAHRQLYWLLRGSKREEREFRQELESMQAAADYIVQEALRAVDVLARELIEGETVPGTRVSEIARDHGIIR